MFFYLLTKMKWRRNVWNAGVFSVLKQFLHTDYGHESIDRQSGLYIEENFRCLSSPTPEFFKLKHRNTHFCKNFEKYTQYK